MSRGKLMTTAQGMKYVVRRCFNSGKSLNEGEKGAKDAYIKGLKAGTTDKPGLTDQYKKYAAAFGIGVLAGWCTLSQNEVAVEDGDVDCGNGKMEL